MVNKEYFGEGKNIEFKREIPSNHEKFLKDIIAFSNSTGGQVILGVEDKTGIVYGIGEQSPFKLSDSISNMISDACTPQIEPDISIQTLEDKTILVIDAVPGKFRPYYLASKGKETSAYIRINGTSRPADTRKLQELELEGQNISYDTLQEIGCEYDEKKALDLCKKMKQIAIDSCETEEEKLAVKDMTLEKLHDFGVLCRVGRNPYPTHAFDLLTDNRNKASKIQCALFKGKTRDIFIDKKEFNGPIYEQVDDAYHFVLRHINMGAEIEGKSTCRNEAIAEAFHYMHIVEAWGTGLPRIINRCKEYGLPDPLFEEFGDGFKVTIYRKVSNGPERVSNDLKKVSNGSKKVSNGSGKVSNDFEKYIPLFEEAEVTNIFINNIEQVFGQCGIGVPFGQTNVMEWLNCSKSKATNIMNAMKAAKVIKKVTGLGPGKYEFVEV